MFKNLLSASLVATLGMSVIASASAADGKITFTGTISDSTCTVTGGSGTNGGVSDFTVALPTVQVDALSAADKVAGATPFEVKLGGSTSTGCKDAKVASLYFEPTSAPINAATGRLTNQSSSSAATNVEVELLNKANTAINLATGANAAGSEETITGSTATLKYTAQYHATGGKSTAGGVSTYVNYSVVYK